MLLSARSLSFSSKLPRVFLYSLISATLMIMAVVAIQFAYSIWVPALAFVFIYLLVASGAYLLDRFLRETERSYQHQLSLMQTLINEAPAAMAMCDSKMHYIAASKRWLSDYKLDGFAVIGRSHYDVFPEISQRWRDIHKRCLAGAVESAKEELFIRSDGSKHWISWEVRPWMRNGGSNKIGGLLMYSEDVTAMKEAYELEVTQRAKIEVERALRVDAEKSLKAKDDFVATLSHELRTPLNSMLGWAHLLKRFGDDPERRSNAIKAIESSGQMLAEIISDILDINRIASGKLRLNLSEFSVGSIIEGAIQAAIPDAQLKGLEIANRIELADVTLVGDAIRLKQCLSNLLSNAIKFTNEGGKISVLAALSNDRVRISVADNGMGIRPELLPSIFERFTQADLSSTRAHGGLGLGLAIVKHLVELHGGTVAAESPGVKKGSTFTITLPLPVAEKGRDLATPAIANRDQPQMDNQIFGGLSLLIVDDYLPARELLRGALEDGGARVYTAASASDGLKIALENKPAILISDIAMPESDGCDLISELRANGYLNPAIALSAYTSPADMKRAYDSGFDRYLAKPIEIDELFRVISELRPATQLRQTR